MTACRCGKPGERELWRKIRAARTLIGAGDWEAVNPGHLDDGLRELEEAFDTEWVTEDDKLALFRMALSEIRASHYSEPRRTPEISVELKTQGLEMWKFKWQSNEDCFGKSVMFFKFSVIGTGEQGPLYIYSLHIDRPPLQD